MQIDRFVGSVENCRNVVEIIENHNTPLAAKVAISEMMGNELHVHAEFDRVIKINDDNKKDEEPEDEQKKMIIRTPILGMDESIAKSIGTGGNIYFTFAPEVMHLFDKETRKNMRDTMEPHNTLFQIICLKKLKNSFFTLVLIFFLTRKTLRSFSTRRRRPNSTKI